VSGIPEFFSQDVQARLEDVVRQGFRGGQQDLHGRQPGRRGRQVTQALCGGAHWL
jgi:hypothetical protein